MPGTRVLRPLLVVLWLSGACRTEGPPPEPAVPAGAVAPAADDGLVPFASEESMRRLERSLHKVDFFTLANHFEGQQHGGMCGPTTAVIVLNALLGDDPSVDKPRDTSAIPEKYRAGIPPRFDPYFRRYTQRTFFDDARVHAVKPEEVFYGRPPEPGARPDPGMQLRQLHEIFLGMGLTSHLHVVADDVPDEPVRAVMVDNLARGGDYVVVNYHRGPLDQEGGGHISPVAAYDAVSDSFLVLDVNPNQGKTWAWVPARRLIAAMRTADTQENRGFLSVSREVARPAP